MRYEHTGDRPVYSPNSYGGPAVSAAGEDYGWHSDGEMLRAAYTLRAEDDDFGQPGTLVRAVLDDAARARLAGNVTVALRAGVSAPVTERALAYWRAIDKALGDQIAAGVAGVDGR